MAAGSRFAVECRRVRREPAARSAARTGAFQGRRRVVAETRSATQEILVTSECRIRKWNARLTSRAGRKPGPIPPGRPVAGRRSGRRDARRHQRPLPDLSAPRRPSLLDRRRADGVVRDELGADVRRAVLDLGSGIGSVGMIAAWRLPGARFVTIEAQDESVRLARKSAAYNGLRVPLRDSPRRFPRSGGPDARLWQRRSGSISCSAARRTFRPAPGSKAIIRRRSRAGSSCAATSPTTRRTAARHLAAGGVFACVFPEEQIARVEMAARDAALDDRAAAAGGVQGRGAAAHRAVRHDACVRPAGADARAHVGRAAARHSCQQTAACTRSTQR